jgi:hypothetical protein
MSVAKTAATSSEKILNLCDMMNETIKSLATKAELEDVKLLLQEINKKLEELILKLH